MTTFDPMVPGTFQLADGLFFRKIERRTGGPNNNDPNRRGIWFDVELTKTTLTHPGTRSPELTIVTQQVIDEGSWLSVVSSMGAAGETSLTYGVAQALHRSGVA